MLNLYAGIADRTDASSTSFRDCAAESPCILVYLLCEDLSSTSSLLACELCADVLLLDMTDESFWNGIWRWFRSAGSDEPMIATVGSTCVGIQNVYPYLSHCGGIARLIVYTTLILLARNPHLSAVETLHFGSMVPVRPHCIT
jgi:hypothetical protein